MQHLLFQLRPWATYTACIATASAVVHVQAVLVSPPTPGIAGLRPDAGIHHRLSVADRAAAAVGRAAEDFDDDICPVLGCGDRAACAGFLQAFFRHVAAGG